MNCILNVNNNLNFIRRTWLGNDQRRIIILRLLGVGERMDDDEGISGGGERKNLTEKNYSSAVIATTTY